MGSTHRPTEQNTSHHYTAGIEILYPEILAHIFQFLSVRDRGRAAQVSRLWYEVSHEKRIWRGVETKLHLRSSSNPGIWSSLRRRGISKVQILSLRRSLRDLVTGLPGITSLRLSGCYSATDYTLGSAFSTPMPQLQNLVILDLSLCKQVTDVSLARISRASPNLRSLELGGCCQISDRGLLLIAWGLRQLLHLNLRSCYFLTDTGIGFLSGHVTLAHLQEAKIQDFLLKVDLLSTDLIPQFSSPTPRVSKLPTWNRNFTNSVHSQSSYPFSAVSPSFSNKRYRPDQCSICHKDMSDGGSGRRRLVSIGPTTIQHQSRLKRKSFLSSLCAENEGKLNSIRINANSQFGVQGLQSLVLQDCQKLTDTSMGHIGSINPGLPNLESINLSFCINLSDSGLRDLSHVPTLKDINLRSCDNISDVGLQNLRILGPRLQSLDISFCDKIRNPGLNSISLALINLRRLSLSATEISDSGLIQLATVLGQLTVLNLGQCTQITDESLKVISEKCDQLEFIDLYGCTSISREGINRILGMPRIRKLNLGLWSTN